MKPGVGGDGAGSGCLKGESEWKQTDHKDFWQKQPSGPAAASPAPTGLDGLQCRSYARGVGVGFSRTPQTRLIGFVSASGKKLRIHDWSAPLRSSSGSHICPLFQAHAASQGIEPQTRYGFVFPTHRPGTAPVYKNTGDFFFLCDVWSKTGFTFFLSSEHPTVF